MKFSCAHFLSWCVVKRPALPRLFVTDWIITLNFFEFDDSLTSTKNNKYEDRWYRISSESKHQVESSRIASSWTILFRKNMIELESDIPIIAHFFKSTTKNIKIAQSFSCSHHNVCNQWCIHSTMHWSNDNYTRKPGNKTPCLIVITTEKNDAPHKKE